MILPDLATPKPDGVFGKDRCFFCDITVSARLFCALLKRPVYVKRALAECLLSGQTGHDEIAGMT